MTIIILVLLILLLLFIIIIKLLCQQQNPRSEYDWLLTALIYGLIDCFRSILSDLTCSIQTFVIGHTKSDS